MKSFAIFSTLALTLAPLAAAHGFVTSFSVDGKRYNGPNPGRGSKTPSVIRQVTSINPINGANNAAINCGPGAQPASLLATVNPGSNLLFHWVAAPGQKWPHNTGGEFTYMASCGNQGCAKFDHNQARWFKVGQDGLVNGQWAQARDAFVNKPSPARIPNNLAPGEYLVAHQLISLHLASRDRGAEFYSSCAQVKVTGNGKGVPSANELVSFPGGYSDNDKGIKLNAFAPNLNYVFPGPPITKLAGTAPPVNNNGGDKPAPEQPQVPETPSKPDNNDGNSCGKKTKRSKKAKRSGEHKPRHISRVMRDIAADLSSGAH